MVLASLFAISTYAKGTLDSSSGLYFEILSDGTASITYSSANEPTSKTTDNYPNLSSDLVIPSTVSDDSNSYTVSAIGEKAFAYVLKLQTVRFASSVKRIEYRAFCRNDSLKEIVLPKTIQYLNKEAFKWEYALKKFQWIPIEVPDDFFFSIGYCNALESVVIGGAIKSIGDYTFIQSTENSGGTLRDVVWYSEVIPNITHDTGTLSTLFGNTDASVTLHVLPGMKAKFEANETWSKVGFVEILEDAEDYVQNEPETGTDNTNENDITVTIRDTDSGYVTMSYDPNTECVLHIQRLASSQSDTIHGITILDASNNTVCEYSSDNIPTDGIINLGKLSQSVVVYVSWDTTLNAQSVYISDDHDTSIFSDNGNLMIQTSHKGEFLSVYAADGTTLLVNQMINDNYTAIPLEKGSIVIVCFDGKSVKMKI
jgi:hypothetical protein